MANLSLCPGYMKDFMYRAHREGRCTQFVEASQKQHLIHT